MVGYLISVFKSIFNNDGLVQSKPYTEPEPDYDSMTKRELEEYGRTIGVELDRRHNKKSLIRKLKAA